MSKSNNLEEMVLDHVLRGISMSGLGANLFLALHTADPGEAGNQTSNEATYTSYARVSKARDNTEFSRTGSTVANINEVRWPRCTGGSETITHWSIGTASTGTGVVLYKGALASSIAVSNTIQPYADAGSLQITED
jgi:hypothetical protein